MAKRSRKARSVRSTPQVHLSASQIRRLSKPRAGFEGPALELLAVLAQSDTVVPNGYDADAIAEKIAEYQAMTVTVREKRLAYEAASDTQMQLGSDIWQSVLVGYQHGKAAARTDPAIAAAIAPFEGFMRKKQSRRKAKTSTPVAPATPSTPTAS